MPETPHSPSKAASDALAAVERYRRHVRRLCTHWMDLELYHLVSHELEEVRRSCQQVPVLSGPWVAVLIAHAELMHALWQASGTPAASGQPTRERLLARVEQSLAGLEAACIKLAGP
jgi:hypothetical protein